MTLPARNYPVVIFVSTPYLPIVSSRHQEEPVKKALISLARHPGRAFVVDCCPFSSPQHSITSLTPSLWLVKGRECDQTKSLLENKLKDCKAKINYLILSFNMKQATINMSLK